MILYLVRHAQSQANVGQSRDLDCLLTDLGWRQAHAAAKELQRLGVTRVCASPYRRTLATANVIAKAAGAPLEVVPTLHEHQTLALPSQWPLLTVDQLRVEFPDVHVPDALVEPSWHRAPERHDDVLERMRLVLHDFERRFVPSDKVAVVSHGSPLGKLVLAFVGVPAFGNSEVEIDNCSLTTLELSGGRRRLLGVNRTDFLTAVTRPEPLEALGPVAPPHSN